jgi:hypothetical protein
MLTSPGRDGLLAGTIAKVAAELLGDPNRELSTRKELRYGNRGSLSVDLEKGCWHDHEAGVGGGPQDLVRRETGLDAQGAAKWLRERGLIDAPPQQRREVARYSYRDEHGASLFEVVRFAPKDFRQQAASGAWSLKGVRRVLYRLPEILAAQGELVLIVEGEKDADKLAALGFTATCNPGGAGKWSADYTKALAGRRCVVIPDNDEPGREHARTVVKNLQSAGIAASTLFLDGLPPKGDVADWLAAGGTADDLRRAIAVLPEPTRKGFDLVRVSDMTFSEPEFLVEGLLETSCLALMFGDPGCGKSFGAIDVACCISTGRNFHGRTVLQGPVVFLAGEGHNGLKRRTLAWERHTGQSLDQAPLYFSRTTARLLDAAHVAEVSAAVDAIAARYGVPRLIVIDTLARSFAGGDENSTQDMSAFVAAVDDMRARFPGCTVLIVHHSGHGDKQRARGAMALKGALDAEYRVERNGEALTVTCTKMKDAPEPAPLGFNLTSVEIGTNRHGEAVTSAVLVETAAVPTKRPRMTPANRLGIDTFMRAKRDAGKGDDLAAEIHLEDWRPVFYAGHTGDTTEAKKKSFQRVRDALVRDGDLAVTDDCYRLARLPDDKP